MNFKQMLKNIKGQVGAGITKLFGALLVIVATVAVAPTIFESLNDSTLIAYAPTWVVTLLILVAGIGIVMLVWKTVGSKN